MIVATLPEPTVRPPSRFVGNIIIMLFHTFYWILCSYSPISAILFEVFKFFRTKIEPRHNNNIINHTLKLATPISNGGLFITPPGSVTGSARGGFASTISTGCLRRRLFYLLLSSSLSFSSCSRI